MSQYQRRSYHRHLPHQIPNGVPIFLTWNLKGSFPQSAIAAIEQERLRLENQPRIASESEPLTDDDKRGLHEPPVRLESLTYVDL